MGSLAFVIAMAPRETQALPCGSTSLAHLKVLDKALQLPVVSDVASKLAGHQLKAVVEGVSSLVTQAEESLVPLLPARLRHCSDTAKEKVGSAVEGLDSLACDGLDQLTSNIPALKENTSELCEVTKVAVYSYLERTKDYLASFTVAQKALLLGDRALQATGDAVQYSGLGSKVEVKSVLCVNFFLSYVGLKIVPAHLRKKETTGSLESSVEEESVEEKLSDADKMVNNKSDEDLDFQPHEHKAEDEIVEISDDKDIQVVEAIGVEASIHPMKNEDLDDEDNEIQVIDVVGDDSKPMLVKIENEDLVNEELKDAAAIQVDSAANDIECVELVQSVEVEAPKEISFDQLLEFHKAEQEKAKLESLVSWSADALTEQLESASASHGEKVFNMGGEEYLILSEENAAEIVSVPDEVKDPLAHREKLESDDNSSEEEAVAEEDEEVDDVQVIDEYDPLADAIGAMNMAEAEDKTDDDDDIQEVSSNSSDSDIN